jgi:hypothetical protein
VTALDDALSSSAPSFAPPSIYVDWIETAPTESSTPGENLYNMSDMLTGEFKIGQSFDDGLPDPVTMTGSNDASGTLTASLIGREGQVLAGTPSIAGSLTGSNSFTSSTVDIVQPVGSATGDYCLAAAVINVVPGQAVTEFSDLRPGESWDMLADVSDGNYRVFIYGRHKYIGMPDPEFDISITQSNAVWAVMSFRALAPNGDKLGWRVSNVQVATAPVSTTAHTIGAVAVTKGFAMAFLGANGGLTYTNTGAASYHSQFQTANASIVMERAGYTDVPAAYTFSVTSSVATATASYVTFAVEPYERPRMSPTRFWSPFNKNSPVYGFDRDTAGVQYDFNTATATGIQPTTLFNGTMSDVTLKAGSDVEMTGVSETRIKLNRSLTLPMVFGRREGCTVDWLVTWLLARGDRFIGPAPGPFSRYWAPLYGSLHAAQDASLGYNYGIIYTPDTPVNPYGLQYPGVVDGPFHSAMFACATDEYIQEIVLDAIDLYSAVTHPAPWVAEQYDSELIGQDQFSLTEASGRISFWLRGDAHASAPSIGHAGDIWSYRLTMQDKAGVNLGRVWMSLDNSRTLNVQMGTQSTGFPTISFGLALPSDGNWHFYSVAWSWWDGTVDVMRDGTTSSSNYWATNGVNVTTGWYDTDAAVYAAGGKISNTVRSRVPMSDLCIESSYDVFTDNFASVWPASPYPSFTATARPTAQQIQAVGGTTPVNAWDTIADLARTVMAMYRCDEVDNFDFLPPSYFGEAAQLTSTMVADTDVNSQDLDVTTDPSRSRNAVTVVFPDTKIDTSYSACLTLTQATEVPKGVSTMTLTLDETIAEIHGASAPYDAWWTLTNLTAAQVTAGTAPNNAHYMSILPDGSGTVAWALAVTAKIVSYTSSTVTLQFTNKLAASAWIVNNYQGDNQLPFMKILGYVVRSADGYVIENDAGSIGVRRERALEAEFEWVQDRVVAQQVASAMVTSLARPRSQVQVIVQGDPRWTPGQLVTLADAQDSQADGTWRAMSIQHNGDGPQYTQTLELVYVLPVAKWDTLPGWDESIWSE